MSLRSKVVLILLFMFILYGIVDILIYQFLIFPSFISLEHDEARKNSERCLQALQREIYHLNSLCHDWAAWDETYDFVQSVSFKYIKSNLPWTSFSDNHLNLIYFYNAEGQFIWGDTYILETKQKIDISELPKKKLPKSHPLISFDFDQKPLSQVSIAGILHTNNGPMLISSRPVLTNENKGPVKGMVIMGRFLNEKFIKMLVKQTQVDFQIFCIRPGKLPEYIKNIPNQITAEFPYLIQQDKDGHMLIFTTFPDINNNPALLIMTKIPKKIITKGRIAIAYGLLSISIVGLTIILVISSISQRIILQPITNLTNHVLTIGKTNDLSIRLNMQQKDETGILAREFDKMLEQLHEARKDLLEKYYYSGMAEMASGVLHNIRNSLSPIMGEIQLLNNDLRFAPIKEIEMVQKELNEDQASNERKENLIQFALLANDSMVNLLKDTKKRLDDIIKRIYQIENILTDHQNMAHSERPVELVELKDLLYDALKLIKKELREIISLKIDPAIADIGPVKVHRIALLQVFLNILINAAESIKKKGTDSGIISIDADKKEDMIQVKICDNGEGIDAKTLPHIFERGFSTKDRRSSGIGLHWCANSMTAMNGRIRAASKGKGQGACFYLMLPQNK